MEAEMRLSEREAEDRVRRRVSSRSGAFERKEDVVWRPWARADYIRCNPGVIPMTKDAKGIRF